MNVPRDTSHPVSRALDKTVHANRGYTGTLLVLQESIPDLVELPGSITKGGLDDHDGTMVRKHIQRAGD